MAEMDTSLLSRVFNQIKMMDNVYEVFIFTKFIIYQLSFVGICYKTFIKNINVTFLIYKMTIIIHLHTDIIYQSEEGN